MYEVSQEYKRAIRKQTRKFEWQGTITTTNGKVYHFTTKDIVTSVFWAFTKVTKLSFLPIHIQRVLVQRSTAERL